MAVSIYFTNAPLLIARAEGYFADEGLDVEFRDPPEAEGGSSLIPALAVGKIDALATSASTGMLNAIAHGAPIRMVVDKGRYAPGHCSYGAIVARKDLDWDGPSTGSRRLRMAASVTSITGYVIQAGFDTLGLDPDDVEFVDVPPPALLSAFERGGLELAHVVEPWVTHLRDAGHTVLLSDERAVPDMQVGIIAFGPTILEADRDAGRRIIRAYLRGVRQYNQGKTERNLEVLARSTGQDRELLRRICWPVVDKGGRINAASLVGFQAWSHREGYLRRIVPEAEFWDPEFVEQAVASRRSSVP